MSESTPPANDDLMQALESLRSLLEKDEASTSAVDLANVPTLEIPVELETSSTTPNVSTAANADKQLQATNQSEEEQLSFAELTNEPTPDIPQPSQMDIDFQEFWEILRPKLKRAVKQSFKELYSQKNR